MLLAEFPWQIFMSPFGIPIAGVIGVFSWLAIASISEATSKVMCNRNDADLKLEMLGRGFSGEEIARVVEAGRDTKMSGWGSHHCHRTAPAGSAASL